MSQSRLILANGATGNQGGSVVDALLRCEHQVRALTRKADSAAANQLRPLLDWHMSLFEPTPLLTPCRMSNLTRCVSTQIDNNHDINPTPFASHPQPPFSSIR